MSRRYAIYLCGGAEELTAAPPCPDDPARLHDARPRGYDADYEYAAQLLSTGWRQHRCPGCGRFQVWRRDDGQPMPLPPMLPRADGEPWDIPDEVDGDACPACDADEPCPAVTR